MKNLLSLTKIGNIKIGKQVNGNPLALEKILVTRATKEYEENFQVYNGFDKEGVEDLEITLPFNDIDLNFEINFVAFMSVDKVDYIAKTPSMDEDVILYPLHPEDFDKDSINFGKLTEEKAKQYNFKETGFLKVMIPEVSGYGEVFYFKTSSINTIRAISDQLKITKKLLDGNLANIPLILKPVKKDLQDGKQIVFLSISYDIIDLKTMKDDIELAVFLKDSINDIEKEYSESRDSVNIVDIDKNAKIVVSTKDSFEVVNLEDKEEKINEILEKEDITGKAEKDAILEVKSKLPVALVVKYLKALKSAEGVEYIDVFKKNMTEGISAPEMLEEIKKYNQR